MLRRYISDGKLGRPHDHGLGTRHKHLEGSKRRWCTERLKRTTTPLAELRLRFASLALYCDQVMIFRWGNFR